MPSIKGAAAIVGIGQTEFSKDSGRSELQLCAEAVRAAIADAGLQPADVDGAVTFTIDPNDELNLMRSVGIREMRWTSRTPFGGGGSSATIEHAAAAVVSGAADVVVVYRAFNERSGRRFGQPMAGPRPQSMQASGCTMAHQFGMMPLFRFCLRRPGRARSWLNCSGAGAEAPWP